MSKEYLEAFERMTEHLDLEDEYSYKQELKDEEIIKKSLQRLEEIDNANLNEALDDLEQLAGIAEIHWDSCAIQKWKNTIEQYILKAQEQEEIVKEYDLKPYELREALLLYAMYKGEYKGNPLPKLKQAQEQEKVLSIIKEKEVDIHLLKACITCYRDSLNAYNSEIKKLYSNHKDYQNKPLSFYLLTEEEFELLKETLKPQN